MLGELLVTGVDVEILTTDIKKLNKGKHGRVFSRQARGMIEKLTPRCRVSSNRQVGYGGSVGL